MTMALAKVKVAVAVKARKEREAVADLSKISYQKLLLPTWITNSRASLMVLETN